MWKYNSTAIAFDSWWLPGHRICLSFTWANNDDEISRATAFQGQTSGKRNENSQHRTRIVLAIKCQLIGSHLLPALMCWDWLRLFSMASTQPAHLSTEKKKKKFRWHKNNNECFGIQTATQNGINETCNKSHRRNEIEMPKWNGLNESKKNQSRADRVANAIHEINANNLAERKSSYGDYFVLISYGFSFGLFLSIFSVLCFGVHLFLGIRLESIFSKNY